MGINNLSIHEGVLRQARARITAANTARDGSGTLVNLKQADNSTDYAGATEGSRIDKITFTSAQASAAASSAMVGRVFMTDSAGSNPRLIAEVTIATVTASNTVVGATATISFTGGLYVPAGCKIGVTQSVYAGAQDQMDVFAQGADFTAQ